MQCCWRREILTLPSQPTDSSDLPWFRGVYNATWRSMTQGFGSMLSITSQSLTLWYPRQLSVCLYGVHESSEFDSLVSTTSQYLNIWLCGVHDFSEFDFMASITSQSLAMFSWNLWVWLHDIHNISQFDSMMSMACQSFTYGIHLTPWFQWHRVWIHSL
jgi:hypothetical protein